MARQPSKILTAAELKAVRTEAKAEVTTHATAIKAAEKAIADARKVLAATTKAVEAEYTKAQKAHIAGLKAAEKAFEAVQKANSKAIEGATKLHSKANAKLAAATAPAQPAGVPT